LAACEGKLVARTYAGILALLAFLTALFQGLLHAGDAEATIETAWCSLWIFAGIGYVLGQIAARTVGESVGARIAAQVAAGQAAEKDAKSPASAASR
jgi:hypothetical protein